MKKSTKLLSIAMALAMLCALLALPAVAVQKDYVVASTDTNATVELTKYMVVDKDAAIPNETFTFTMAPGTGVTTEPEKEVRDDVILAGVTLPNGSASVAFTNTSATTPGSSDSDTKGITTMNSAQKYATGTASFNLEGAKFEAPGIYRYVVSEEAGSTPGIEYDKEEYYVDIYVGYENADAEAAGTMSIIGYNILLSKNKKGDAVTSNAKTSITFPNVQTTNSLTVSKKVTGTLGDKEQDFSFTLNIPATTMLSAGTTFTVEKTLQGSTPTVPLTEKKEITVGTDYNFTLKDGEKIVINGLPSTTGYTVTEADYSGANGGYTTTTKTTGGVDTDPAGNIVTNAIVKGGNTEAFTNDRNPVAPTGVILQILPFVLIIGLAGVGLVLLMNNKRRRSSR